MDHNQVFKTKSSAAYKPAVYTMGRKAAPHRARRAKAYVYSPAAAQHHNAQHHNAQHPTAAVHAQVDDATWDAVVAQLMQEYDGAWTRLADL